MGEVETDPYLETGPYLANMGITRLEIIRQPKKEILLHLLNPEVEQLLWQRLVLVQQL